MSVKPNDFHDLENTKLWGCLSSKTNETQRTPIKEVCKRAADLLDVVRDTFPTYTLHNRVHALNVIRLMGELVDERLQDLSALEAAILILSAYCHDIGMVFEENERKALQSNKEFKNFLKEYPEAFMMIKNPDELPVEVAEWYCRWSHPDRVFDFLQKWADILKWNAMPILDKLGYVCRSHGYDSADLIHQDGIFSTDYLGEADLRFCAVILRLADILDFDNSRSPEEVYKYLGIGRLQNKRDETSDTEWKKHLSSTGFVFKRENGSTILKLLASPNNPAVEHDVRQFLNVIESELHKCNGILKHCSNRWKDFSLPISINRDDIHSVGYKYGEYKFTLDQQRVPELLMGENLYSDPFVFVRELIQNAIDTSRYRLFYETNKNKIKFTPDSIKTFSWIDKEGYQWVRMDDGGMGMSEEIIRNYFLKVGESYYQSNKFRAEILAVKTSENEDFLPISRFGIGVLSCFIACDRIEISTRHIESGQTGAIRLSLSGLHSFYILQTEADKHYNATVMPVPPGMDDSAYRENFGTSIAVRIDPRKEKAGFDLEKLLNEQVECSPIPIICNGKKIGKDYQSLVIKPWLEDVREFKLTGEEKQQLEKVFRIKLSDVIVRLVPLNLTEISPNPNLKGQALFGSLIFSENDEKKNYRNK